MVKEYNIATIVCINYPTSYTYDGVWPILIEEQFFHSSLEAAVWPDPFPLLPYQRQEWYGRKHSVSRDPQPALILV
jgi:hypothetical protein